MNSIENGLLKAIAYADVFDFGLTKIELRRRYIGKKRVDPAAIDGNITELLNRGRLEMEGSCVFFPGRNEVARLRHSRLKPTTQKYLRAKQVTRWLAKIPWIQGVFLTGTVAADNAAIDDDIDLMIVTQPNALWTSRLAVTLILELLGIRRKPEQIETKDIFCVNLYLDETAMAVPTELRSLYTAHEIVLAKCLYEKDGVAVRFIQSNRWVREFLPNTDIPSTKYKPHRRREVNWLENWLFKMQRKYMSRRMTRERVTKQTAYFHPKDMAKLVLADYDRVLNKYEVER